MCSEWQAYKDADWRRLHSLMRDYYCFDGRNMLNVQQMSALGYLYQGVGIGQTQRG
ncbi:hypothetical protein WMW72_26615 [Paenibacillus filicis]|uniref:Uncharacterized protein n=1 Tax=Paenibacillus filicis TaxID=669464 RepID=A0ABU9DRJ4_9BACL